MEVKAPINLEIDIKGLVEEITSNILEALETPKTKEIMTQEELMDYLGCSKNTLRSYEDRGLRPCKIGAKIYYEFEDVRQMIKKYKM